MMKMVLASATFAAAAFLSITAPTTASPLATNSAAIAVEAGSDVTLVQNHRRRGGSANANRNNAQVNRAPPPNNQARDRRRDRRNAAAVGAAVGILGGLLLSQQQPAYAEPAPPPRGFYRDDYHREVFYRCQHRRGFDPHTMTYVNRYGEVRRCR